MAVTQRTAEVSTTLLKVMERAKREPEARFTSLAHCLDEAALERAYRHIRKDAAVGADGVTHEAFGKKLAENVGGLHERLKTKRYRHQPIRRVYIPKGEGKTRPIGVSSIEDKIVQQALREVLEAVYEPVFRDCSYGFRPSVARTTRCGPSNRCSSEVRGTGFWRPTSRASSTASIARC
jgi:RNA-directed DNA polymerase